MGFLGGYRSYQRLVWLPRVSKILSRDGLNHTPDKPELRSNELYSHVSTCILCVPFAAAMLSNGMVTTLSPATRNQPKPQTKSWIFHTSRTVALHAYSELMGEEPWDGNCKDRLGGSTVQKPRSFMSQRRSNVKSSNYIDTPGERTQHKSIVIQPSNQCIKSTTSSVILGEQLRTINP